MSNKIENPKVFISYAWADKDYENMVLEFASKLVLDGIDVVFDKWDLTEGNDTYAFMEKCVNDPSITNVLMLLDPVYASKANAHIGGVGTETQIISAKVYCEVEQDKFIPVIMRRDSNGKVCKPIYLEGRLHFDLTDDASYDETYQRLVKKLFGAEIYAKPAIGKKPEWVDKPIEVNPQKTVHFDSVKKNKPETEKIREYKNYLEDVSKAMIDFAEKTANPQDPEKIIELYQESEIMRNDYLKILKNSYYVSSYETLLTEFFERLSNSINKSYGFNNNKWVIKIRIHEMFIYTIAFYLKNNDYNTVGYFLGKTYFNQLCINANNGADSFHMFYSGAEHQKLDYSVNTIEQKNYYTGTGEYWLSTIANDICSKEQFIFADLICFNVSVFGKKSDLIKKWFPTTYVYDNGDFSVIQKFAGKMISKEFISKILTLFFYEELDDFIANFKDIQNNHQSQLSEYRYSRCFESPSLLSHYIRSEDIAKYR